MRLSLAGTERQQQQSRNGEGGSSALETVFETERATLSAHSTSRQDSRSQVNPEVSGIESDFDGLHIPASRHTQSNLLDDTAEPTLAQPILQPSVSNAFSSPSKSGPALQSKNPFLSMDREMSESLPNSPHLSPNRLQTGLTQRISASSLRDQPGSSYTNYSSPSHSAHAGQISTPTSQPARTRQDDMSSPGSSSQRPEPTFSARNEISPPHPSSSSTPPRLPPRSISVQESPNRRPLPRPRGPPLSDRSGVPLNINEGSEGLEIGGLLSSMRGDGEASKPIVDIFTGFDTVFLGRSASA